MHGGTSVFMDGIAEKPVRRQFPARRVIVQIADDFPAERPKVVHVLANGLWGEIRQGQMFNKGTYANHQSLAGRQIFFPPLHERGQLSRSRQKAETSMVFMGKIV